MQQENVNYASSINCRAHVPREEDDKESREEGVSGGVSWLKRGAVFLHRALLLLTDKITMIMKKDCYFYEAGVILLGSFQLCPLLLLLGSTIISVALGVCWVLVLAWFYTSTIIGRRFLRAWYNSTIIIERALLGND